MSVTDLSSFSIRTELALPVAIRLCRQEDLEPLEWFGRYRAHREVIRAAFEAQRRSENLMLVADVGGFPAGQAWVDLAKRKHLGAAVIWAVRVFPAFRGAGLASTLIGTAEALARRCGCIEAVIGVERRNERARVLYEKLGYRLAGAIVEPYAFSTPDGRRIEAVADQWVLSKPLATPELVLGDCAKDEGA